MTEVLICIRNTVCLSADEFRFAGYLIGKETLGKTISFFKELQE
jgi:hypothetical protein